MVIIFGLLWALAWWLVGFISCVIWEKRETGYVTIRDAADFTFPAIFGPMVTLCMLILIFDRVADKFIYKKIKSWFSKNQDRVLW